MHAWKQAPRQASRDMACDFCTARGMGRRCNDFGCTICHAQKSLHMSVMHANTRKGRLHIVAAYTAHMSIAWSEHPGC